MEVGLGPGRFCVSWGPRLPLPKKGAEPPNFRPMFTVAGWIKIVLGTEEGLSPGDLVVLDGDPAPPQKGGIASSPIFGPFLLWPNRWMNQDDTCHGGGPWSKPHCARWGPISRPPKRGGSPQFSAHFYCRQTAGCIKMPLGMEVGLIPGEFVLDGNPASPPLKGTATTIFGQCPLRPNDWMD